MEELQQSQQESIISDNDNNIPLTKKKRTINAPRSEKQIEAFKKAQEKRDDNRRIIKEQKEIKLAKIFMENKLNEQQQQSEQAEQKPLKKEKKQIIKYVESESDDDDDEIIYVKKPKKKIIKPKKIVYESSEDDDEPPMIEKKPVLKRQSNRVIRTKQDNDDIIDFHSFFI